ncbi:MAG: hypothetical protein VX186_00775, partial [Nitrospinota bacterium]|nr:hypothetical protein [Nitrospinota bacterium]
PFLTIPKLYTGLRPAGKGPLLWEGTGQELVKPPILLARQIELLVIEFSVTLATPSGGRFSWIFGRKYFKMRYKP